MSANLPSQVHAFGDDALGNHDAVGLVEALASGAVSRAEALEAAIARIETVNPHLNAVVVKDFDRARTTTPAKGYFAGVPSIIKDNSDVAGLPTQQGSSAYRARAKKKDGDLARHFLSTGLVNLGKSQLSEFGFSASAEFPDRDPVRNPWSTAHSSGASSAGSAVLVASGALPIAHANDGGGSIRIPAACNGLVGLKPSRGRVLGDAATRSLPVRIIADGAVTRSVRDTAAFFREYERSYAAPGLPAIGDVTGPSDQRLRIGVVLHSPVGPSDPELVTAVRGVASLLESLGHHVEEVEAPVPDTFTDDFLLYWSLLAALELGAGKLLLDPSFKASKTDNLSRGLARNARRNLRHIPGAIKRLKASSEQSADFYKSYDLTLNPTLAAPTPELGWLNPAQPYEVIIENLMSWVRFTPLQNATGDPAISLPLATDSRGLPLGVQLGAPIGHERRLLEVAYELEAAHPFARLGG